MPLAKESDTQEKLEILAKDPLGYKVMKEIVCGTVNEGLSDISWKEIYVEIEQKCPTTMKFLITLVDGMDTEGKKMAPVFPFCTPSQCSSLCLQ